MAVELEHRFTTTKPLDESFATILDLERVVPCVEGGRVLESTGPTSVRAEIGIKLGAMSLTFTGTVEVVEQTDDLPRVRSVPGGLRSARDRAPRSVRHRLGSHHKAGFRSTSRSARIRA